ncbi:MAG: nucleoside kinase [Bacteroidales bacterium]|nr:nucleoside kinase [Bacteroidales bacterium]
MEKKYLDIYCENTEVTKQYPVGTTLSEIADDQNITMNKPILGAFVNNKIKELNYSLFKPKVIKFFDLETSEGQKMYQRSLCFLLVKALHDVDKTLKITIDHSISKGFYCELSTSDDKDFKPTEELVEKLKNRMQQLVNVSLPIERKEILSTNAAEIFKAQGMTERVRLFEDRGRFFSSVYSIDGFQDYYTSYLVPNTKYLTVFDLILYYDGLLLRFPTDFKTMTISPLEKQVKLFEVFREYKSWGKLLGISSVDTLNLAVKLGCAGEIIKVAEALHEKKIAQIADLIKQKGGVKLVLIAGPSSSGKTTTSKRLCVQLRVAGLKPVQISLDNYFVNRENTPKDEKGDYDFEALEAVDYEQFNQDILDMTAGKRVEMPIYNFHTGKREYKGDFLTADEKTVFVVEGIHGLNPKMSGMIPDDKKFKIYVSALTPISIDSHNRIPTTDNRLLRRIIRDFRYRHYSAEETIRRWPSVRRGENKNIFPFQEEADVMFNSALPYELGVIKTYAEPVLQGVNETVPEYAEAQRLIKFLSYFKEFPDNEIPPTSILREFLTGSSFHY